MYDYLRYYIEGVTPQVCQDKCMENYFGLTGISTYDSTYCYCWFDNNQLPSKLPSDIHGYSSRFKGLGEVMMTLNDDGDCYKFIENEIDTESPTQMPTGKDKCTIDLTAPSCFNHTLIYILMQNHQHSIQRPNPHPCQPKLLPPNQLKTQ